MDLLRLIKEKIIVVANQGLGNASSVIITDALPVYVDGLDLNQTVDITAGQRVTFTLNVTLATNAPPGGMITNTAFFSHTSGSSQDSTTFIVEQMVKIYLPIVLKN